MALSLSVNCLSSCPPSPATAQMKGILICFLSTSLRAELNDGTVSWSHHDMDLQRMCWEKHFKKHLEADLADNI